MSDVDYNADAANRIVVRWSGDDGDGTGCLSVVAAANGYAGEADAWFDKVSVLEFAAALAQYPLPDHEISLGSGLGAGEQYEELVGFSVATVGSRGQIGLRVHVATFVWPDDVLRSKQEARFEL